MATFEEPLRPKPAAHTLGEDLSALSEQDLVDRIALLRGEITRLDEALAARRATRQAAAAFFRN
jgi:uncharacterized small protein (DUF1192 family)